MYIILLYALVSTIIIDTLSISITIRFLPQQDKIFKVIKSSLN